MTYPNLRAEMARLGLTAKEVADIVNMKYDTFINKLNYKSDFTRGEIFAIRDALFPNCKLDELFMLNMQDTA